MPDERHATADTRHRSSIGGSLFQRAMSLGWWQWPQWSQVNQLAGQQRVSERHMFKSSLAIHSKFPNKFLFFFLYESYLWYWKRHIHNVRLKIYLLLIVRGDILLKMKPFEATRRNLMSALCGSVCVLAYYLLIIEICMMEIFLLYHHCYCQKYTNKRKKLSSSNLSPLLFVFPSLHEAWQPLAHCQKLLTNDKHFVRVAAAPLPGYLCARAAHYNICAGCKPTWPGFL